MIHIIAMAAMTLRQFLKCRRGGITPMFALAIIPVFGLIGAAVDYSRANSVRTAMQAAADSTALMLSKDAASLTASQISTKGTAYFQALFNRPEAKNLAITSAYTATGGSQLIITASASVDSSFMKLMGYPQLNIGTSSTVKWGNTRLRVALVLDNTGSMADAGKITALKTASKALLTQLKNAASQNGDVYVSIIPFSKDVNVGASNYNQTWVDFADHGSWDGWDTENGNDVSTTTCTKNGKKKKCKISTSWVPDNHNTWNGCVTDRDQDNDTTNVVPSAGNQGTLFPAEQYDSCPVQLLPLTYDWTALNNKIDAMNPNGNTNQTIGLQWGFQSLTAYPFTIPALDPNYKYSQVVIMLTDGLNTENRFSTDQTTIDNRTKKACDNIKNAGITLYTLQVNTGGDPTSVMLQNCATDPGKFFLVTSSSQISTIFNQIGTALTQLRISK